MAAKRIIPCLDVKDARVVKGINFKGLRDMGHPAEMGVRYGQEGADELVFLDIVASEEGAPPGRPGSRRWPPPSASPSPWAAASPAWRASAACCGRGRRQGGPEHRRHRRSGADHPGRGGVRPPVRGGGGGRGPGPGAGLAGVRQGRQRAHRPRRRRLAARAGGPGRRRDPAHLHRPGRHRGWASTWTSWTCAAACPSR